MMRHARRGEAPPWRAWSRPPYHSPPLPRAPAPAALQSRLQGRPRGIIATHAVYPATGRGRGRADVEPGDRRGIRYAPEGGSEEELAKRVGATADVSTDEIRVARLQLSRAHHTSGQNQIAEAGREALDLRLNA